MSQRFTKVRWLGVPELFSMTLSNPSIADNGNVSVMATVISEAGATYTLSSTGGTVNGNTITYGAVASNTLRTVVATNNRDSADTVSAQFTQEPDTDEFTLSNAGFSFTVSNRGAVSMTITSGAFANGTYTITDGTTSVTLTRMSSTSYTGSTGDGQERTWTISAGSNVGVTAPNDPDTWSNANELVTVAGQMTTQPATPYKVTISSITPASTSATVNFGITYPSSTGVAVTIQWGTNEAASNGGSANIALSATSYTITGLAVDTSYNVRMSLSVFGNVDANRGDTDSFTTLLSTFTTAQANAAVSFSVSTAGIVSYSSSLTLSGVNLSNGHDFGEVATPTTRTLTGNVTVPTGYTNTNGTVAFSKQFTQQVAYEFSPWVDDGDPYGGTAGTPSYGDWGEWTSQTTPSTQMYLNEIRYRDVTTPYTGGSQDQTRGCQIVANDAAVSTSLCSSDANDFSQTLTGQSYNIFTANGDSETRNNVTPNPNYIPTFVFSDISLVVSGALSIATSTGNILGIGTVDSGYTDAEGNSINCTIALASGQISSYGPLAAGAASVTRTINVSVTMDEIPEGFQNEGTTDLVVTGSVMESQSSPALPAVATTGRFAFEDVLVTNSPDGGATVSVTTNGSWQVTDSLPSGASVTTTGASTANGSISISAAFVSNADTGTYHIGLFPSDSTALADRLDLLTVTIDPDDG